METILSYLDNMFLNLPKTEKIMKVKKDLSLMMEEKYNELLAEGKKKNEAIGIVISEFGDLKELQEELGLGENIAAETFSEEKSGEEKKTVELKKGDSFEKDHIKESEKKLKSISREEAENYREISKRAAKGISCGVMLCICSPVFILLCAMLDEIQQDGIADALYILGGIVPLFLMVGIAVALFIINGKMGAGGTRMVVKNR